VAEDAQSEVSEVELQERELREEMEKLEADEHREESDFTIHGVFGRARRWARGATTSHLRTDRGRGGQWPGLGLKSAPLHSLHRPYASMIKQKKRIYH